MGKFNGGFFAIPWGSMVAAFETAFSAVSTAVTERTPGSAATARSAAWRKGSSTGPRRGSTARENRTAPSVTDSPSTASARPSSCNAASAACTCSFVTLMAVFNHGAGGDHNHIRSR